MARNMAGPLLFLNLVLYCIVVGFASWCINRYINGQSAHPGVGGNGATMFFLVFALSAGVVGIVSKLPGALHVRAWRGDSLAAAASSSVVAFALTALAFGLAWKEINVGGYRGWRLRVLEAFVIIVTITQFLYILALHAGHFSSRYGPGYRDTPYSGGIEPKGGGRGVTGARV
ncbi:membrane protein PM19L-like [Eucalyptus grandis]|uniref:membrane protein PM19L-like n=1 Tax=Eucalyptus grandis TaxID=71139 RepID=UPI00192EB5A2|nr:membrane protein PM19L-like [Eucalyptus grandis]